MITGQNTNEPTRTGVQLGRYFLVGGTAFLVDTGIFVLLVTHTMIPYWIAAVISYSVGIIVNYYLGIKLVFDTRRYRSQYWLEFGLVFLISLTGLIPNQFCIWLFYQFFGLPIILSKLITGVIVFLWNFIGRKIFVF